MREVLVGFYSAVTKIGFYDDVDVENGTIIINNVDVLRAHAL